MAIDLKANALRRRPYSIRYKFFFAVGAVALVFIGILIALNVFFYDDYYLWSRKSELLNAHTDVCLEFAGNPSSLASLLDLYESKGAIRFGVIAADGTVLYATAHAQDDPDQPTTPDFWDVTRYRSYAILSAVFRGAQLPLHNDVHQFLSVTLQGKEQYMCMIGALDKTAQVYLIVYMPYAILQQNSALNLTFLLIASGCALALSLIFAYVISRQFSRPLISMAQLADRMSELDFTSKYEGTETDEIGLLGQSLNRLSTYLKQAIGELQRSNAQLAQEIEEKERIDSMRREFIVNVSHELKTPIALIQGYAEGLTAGIADSPEDRAFYCNTIAEEAAHMNRLVMQLLSLSKLELGAEQPEYEEVDLQQLCQQAVHKTYVLCEARQLHITCRIAPTTVCTDADLVEQVLMNYLSNAIRYTAEGGQIVLSTETTEQGIYLQVFNQGEGLPEDELQLIWEKFYRTDRARSRENGGTGIGLSLVRAIADTLHGDCGAHNVSDGILFWFFIPDDGTASPCR